MDLTKIEFHNENAVGDILMMTCGIRDLKASYPDRYLISVNTTAKHVWDYNPNLSDFEEPDMIVNLGPKKITQMSQTSGLHYANGFRISIEQNLNIPIRQGKIKPDIYLSEEEKADRLIDGQYWILVAGGKADFTTKIWPPEYWQQVINHYQELTFVQVGESKHDHPVFEGDNVINLIGHTEHPDTGIRDLFKLFYHCDGSLGLVSMQMHLAAAFDKACVVVAGAREPVSFERYNHHMYLCNQGAMRCRNDCDNCKHKKKIGKRSFCDIIDSDIPPEYHRNQKLCPDYDPIDPAKIYIKSCWKSKIEGCQRPVSVAGRTYAKCLTMIRPEDVIKAIDTYYEGGALQPPSKRAVAIPRTVHPYMPVETEHAPFPVPTDKPIFKMVCNAHAYIGGERSVVWILNAMIAAGYHVQMVPTKHVCEEFRSRIPDVEITNRLTDPCDILMIYANDMVWEFSKPRYSIMDQLQADRKIMMLNYKLGSAGKAPWTTKWDLYGFLCSQMRDEFLKRVPDASCFVLPPAVDLEPFFATKVKYNQTLHFVRHSSQGDRKFPPDINEMIASIRSVKPKSIFSFMPPPSFLNGSGKVHQFKTNEIPVTEFLSRGNCYLYPLPDDYSDQGPRTIVEAMAAGLPVIADNRWGAKDRVTPETGWLCDNREDYIDTIGGLNHKILAEKGTAAKDRARQEFDPHNWIKVITS